MSQPTILMCRPVNLNDMDRAVNAQLGFDISDPYPGSVQQVCNDCGREVWVGPRQQATIQLLDDYIICCPTHACIRAGAAPESYEVFDLGNKHPRESHE